MALGDMIWPAFCADALSLGPHWVYNQEKLARLYPEGVLRYDEPRSSYHEEKRAGDLTHYGEQMLVLMRSLVLRQSFDLDGWVDDWQRFWEDQPRSYMDTATSETLDYLGGKRRELSSSNDLGGAARIAPILALLADVPLAQRIEAARLQTQVTHGDQGVVDAAEYFTRVVDAIMSGDEIAAALETAARVEYQKLDARGLLEKAREHVGLDALEAGDKLGLTCHLPEAFPLTLCYLLKYANNPVACLSANAMAGGDSAARGMLLGLMFGAAMGTAWLPTVWLDELIAGREIEALMTLAAPGARDFYSENLEILHPAGHRLAAVLDRPNSTFRAVALYAHCFTCGKNLRGATRVARLLAGAGIATLRIDFTGLGASGGDFSQTGFISNVEDLTIAAQWLDDNLRAPRILIGHSLGGAAVLAAAAEIKSVRGVATIGAPCDPAHVTHLLGNNLEQIRSCGVAEVQLAGRKFRVGKDFLDQLENLSHAETIARLRCDLLIMHSPSDKIVSIEQARCIYEAANHPKSFYSLAGADHLLSDPRHADHAAAVIAAWAGRL